MRTTLLSKALIGTALLLMMALPSAAATIDSWVDMSNGTFAGVAPTGSVPTGPGSPSNPFSSDFDYFSFTVQKSWVAAEAYTQAPGVTILAVQLVSFDGTVLAQSNTSGTLSFAPWTLLAAGDYYVGVSAVGGSLTASDGYSGFLAVSQVPLPSSLPLFGTTLLGFGVVSALKRNKRKLAS